MKLNIRLLKIITMLLFACMLITGCRRSWPQPSENPGSQPTESSGTSEPVYPDRSNTLARQMTLDEGRYKVGQDEDIPPGRYRITGQGVGNIYVYKYSIPYLSEILNWSFYGVSSLAVDLTDAHSLEVAELESATLVPLDTAYVSAVQSGEWISGLDFEPGRYELKVDSDAAGKIYKYDVEGWVTFSQTLGGVFAPESLEINLGAGEVLIVQNLDHVDMRRLGEIRPEE